MACLAQFVWGMQKNKMPQSGIDATGKMKAGFVFYSFLLLYEFALQKKFSQELNFTESAKLINSERDQTFPLFPLSPIFVIWTHIF